MKKKKYERQIGYGVAGLVIGAIIYVMLLVDIPVSVEARSTLMEFTNKEQVSSEDDYVLDDEDYDGSIRPLLQFGSYHVSAAGFKQYEANGIVKYGKVNPMFYFEKPKVVAEGEGDVNPGGQTPNNPSLKLSADDNDNPTNPGDNNTGNDNQPIEKDVVSGFNIHTAQVESFDVGQIKKEFKKHGQLPLDIEHMNISSEFGIRQDPFVNTRAYHVGTDFSTSSIDGTRIYSVMPGEVVKAVASSSKEGLGNYVIVKHDGFETLYAHMKNAPIHKEGDMVKGGETIGYVGTTGRSTGPHLHFEVGIGGLKANPVIFLNEIRK